MEKGKVSVSAPSPGLGRHRAALVLFSGGQDSTTVLAWALETFDRVETVGIDYGQRHSVELECRQRVLAGLRAMKPEWNERLGADHALDLSVLGQISDCALTREKAIELGAEGVPNTFVPARNLIFFTLASALAYRRGISVIAGGMCETDFSGYADCRDDTIKSLQATLSLGLGRSVVLETPLMWLDKAQTWAFARRLGGEELVELIRTETHTCYRGAREVLHDWGYGCGECPACRLRAEGWRRFCTGR